MKKLLFSLLMLCCMTAAWAGTGDGTKDDPFTGEWDFYDLRPKIKEGCYIAYNCRIDYGYIVVTDSRLNEKLPVGNGGWTPMDAIGESPLPIYEQYCNDNSIEDRKKQSFIVTKVTSSSSSYLDISGYFSGLYTTPDADGFVYVATANQMKIVLNGNAHAKIRLTDDIYLSDLGADFDDTFCSTFYGVLDGDGHAIKGDHYADDSTERRNRTYLFTYTDGATIKNITFKHISKESTEHNNQAIITSQAQNGCVFEDITIDNVGVYTKTHILESPYNVGAVAGQAKNCIFNGITVNNSEFISEASCAGAVVGDATGCEFNHIEVNNCHIKADKNLAGGVVGLVWEGNMEHIKVYDCNVVAGVRLAGGVAGELVSREGSLVSIKDVEVKNTKCTVLPPSVPIDPDVNNAGGVVGQIDCRTTLSKASLSDIKIINCYIKNNNRFAGGIVGTCNRTHFTNCYIDDQSCIRVDGDGTYAYAGGIAGKSTNCDFHNCVNYALVAADDNYAGGIVGYINNGSIEDCLNAGMVISAKASTVDDELYSKYKNKQMSCVTKTYKGVEYAVRKADLGSTGDNNFGGIAGNIENSTISRCANFGWLNETDYCAGIAGLVEGDVTISDCLNDFSAPSKVYGIMGSKGDSDHNIQIIRCVNVSGNKSLPDENNVHYVHQLITSENRDLLATGEATWHFLNEANSKAWEQNIGTDPYPTPTSTGNRGLYHTRTLSNEYGTICLPFDAVSDENIRFYTLKDQAVNENLDAVALIFTYTENLEAGTPALFYAKTDRITLNDPNGNHAGTPAAPIIADGSYTDQSWSMVGTYEQKVFQGDAAKSIYYVSGNAIKNAKKTTIAPFRAYISGPAMEEEGPTPGGYGAKTISFILEDEDGTTTALEFVGDELKPNHNVNPNLNGVYNLAGQKVDENYRGIVIKNGRKVLKK